MKRLACLLLCALLAACGLCAAAEDTQKVVYLTFDDGPNAQTPELLALLRELDVPATFFLVGSSVAACPENAKMILDAGHAVGCHSMRHSMSRIRESTDYAGRDVQRFMETMREYVDPEFTTDLYRFPGGSGSYSSRTKAYIRDLGFAWFDWSASNEDARFTYDSDRALYEYTIKELRRQGDVVILLMHEGKKRTRRVLPDVVAYLREEGYTFRTLSTGEEDRDILARCPANMMFPERAGAQTEGGM